MHIKRRIFFRDLRHFVAVDVGQLCLDGLRLLPHIHHARERLRDRVVYCAVSKGVAARFGLQREFSVFKRDPRVLWSGPLHSICIGLGLCRIEACRIQRHVLRASAAPKTPRDPLAKTERFKFRLPEKIRLREPHGDVRARRFHKTEIVQRVASELRAVFRQPYARIGKPRFPRRNGALQHCMLLLRPRIQPQHDCRARTCEHNQHCQHNQQNPSRSSHVPFSIQAELPPSLCEILYQFSRQLQPKAPIYPALLQFQRPRRGGRLCPPDKLHIQNAKITGEFDTSLGWTGATPTRFLILKPN